MKYFDIFEIVKGDKEAPTLIDAIPLHYKGIDVNVYGVLHGVTGGTNKDYVDFINKTIKEAKGTKFCEKSMKTMYKGLDKDVHDWRQMRCRDAFQMSFKSFLNPYFPYILVKTMIKEKLKKSSDFGKDNFYSACDISKDKQFHLIKPSERRILAGFPHPEDYMKLNLARRNNKVKKSIDFVDPDWKWLTFIEPYANIPMRSIHMIEYVVEYCRKHDIKEASLFIGEVHNSDIEWYVNCQNNNVLPEFLKKQSILIHNQAMDVINNNYKKEFFKYLLSLGAGSLLSMSIYTLIIYLFLIYL